MQLIGDECDGFSVVSPRCAQTRPRLRKLLAEHNEWDDGKRGPASLLARQGKARPDGNIRWQTAAGTKMFISTSAGMLDA
jgi:hypothetical protein